MALVRVLALAVVVGVETDVTRVVDPTAVPGMHWEYSLSKDQCLGL